MLDYFGTPNFITVLMMCGIYEAKCNSLCTIEFDSDDGMQREYEPNYHD